MKTLLVLFCACCLLFMGSAVRYSNADADIHDQIRKIAIQDFLKTDLFKQDSVFIVSTLDTIGDVKLKKVDSPHYNHKWVRVKTYPELIGLDILGVENKYFVDTTMSIDSQKAIPTGFTEQGGKLFVWWDNHRLITDSTIKILDKYHKIGRGKGYDWFKIEGGTNDAKQGTDYYFCRNNLSVYKKRITSAAIGYYDPPKIDCR
jgi:hypothetical protein